MKKFFADFKAFAMKGNVIDMAVGVIIGAAFGKIVSSAVSDVLMPLLSPILGKGDFKSYFVALNGQHYDTIEAAKAASAPILTYGNFVQTIIDFTIVALVIFIVLKKLMPVLVKEKPAAAPTTRECPECCSNVPIKAKRCAHCASPLPA